MLLTIIGLRRAEAAAPEGKPFRVKTKTLSAWTGLSDKTTRLALSVLRDTGRFFFRRTAGGYEYRLPPPGKTERITWFPNIRAADYPLAAMAALYAGLSWADFYGKINPAFYGIARRRRISYTRLLAERGRCGEDFIKDGLRLLRETGIAAGDFRGRKKLRFYPDRKAERRTNPAADEGGLPFPPGDYYPDEETLPDTAAEETRRKIAVSREAAAEEAWRKAEEAERRKPPPEAKPEGTGKIPTTPYASIQAISPDLGNTAGFTKKPCRNPSTVKPFPTTGGGRRRKDAWNKRLDKISATGGRKPGPVSAAERRNGDNRKGGRGGGGSPVDAAIAASTGINPAEDATFRAALETARYRRNNPDYPWITSPVRYAIRLYECYRRKSGKRCPDEEHPGPCGKEAEAADRAEAAAWRKGFPAWKARREAERRREEDYRREAGRDEAERAAEDAVEAEYRRRVETHAEERLSAAEEALLAEYGRPAPNPIRVEALLAEIRAAFPETLLPDSPLTETETKTAETAYRKTLSATLPRSLYPSAPAWLNGGKRKPRPAAEAAEDEEAAFREYLETRRRREEAGISWKRKHG